MTSANFNASDAVAVAEINRKKKAEAKAREEREKFRNGSDGQGWMMERKR